MVSLWVTAFGHLIDGKSASETYECLNAMKFLRRGTNRSSVVALIELALQKPLGFGDESWRVVQEDLLEADVLTRKGIAATGQYMTRRGKRVRWWWRFTKFRTHELE